jgi:dTDP-4-dehydrorhamnose reductase
MAESNRILILGASGLFGHKLWQRLGKKFPDTWATVRGSRADYDDFKIFQSDRIIYGSDLLIPNRLEEILNQTSPDVIINSVGITKRHLGDSTDSKRICDAIRLNSELPHAIAAWAKPREARVIHFSTDCVFDGKKGHYKETDLPTPTDLYGQTKFLGEPHEGEGRCFTLRSSFIGRELFNHTELLEWFLQQKGKKIRGFRQAIYSGIASWVLADIVGEIIEKHPHLNGLYQVASQQISKYDLLCQIRQIFNIQVEIEPDDNFVCKRNLDGSRFLAETGIEIPSWQKMLEGIVND